MPRALEFVESGPADATAVVVWLHGLGADGWDFYPVVPELGLPAAAKVRFVFPHAEPRPVTLNNGFVMRAWYDIRALDLADRSHDERGIRESAEQIAALIAAEEARGVPPGRIVLAGFSQGAAMALHVGLRHPRRLRGIVALSSYLLLAPTVAAETSPANAGQEIFQAHGTADDV
ncbi:MAG: alpha/beta fold hydrolase, partial [Acidobacteria bacterium]|nr:alpha/beta fold hydrolase [Acidobacteriota bacterium]